MENTANSAIATHIECVIDQASEHYDQLMRVLSRRSLLKGLHGYSGHVKASSSYWVSHYHPLSLWCQSAPPDVGCGCIYVCSNACGCAPTCVCVESAPHGRVRACEPLSTFYLFIVLFHILSTVSRSLSVLARCHSDRKAVTHTYTCKHADYTKSIHFLLLESKLICAPLQFFFFFCSPVWLLQCQSVFPFHQVNHPFFLLCLDILIYILVALYVHLPTSSPHV